MTQAVTSICNNHLAVADYVKLLRLGKAKAADATMGPRGRGTVDPKVLNSERLFDPVDITKTLAGLMRTKMERATVQRTNVSRTTNDSGYTDTATARRTDASRSTKDSAYGSYRLGSTVQEDRKEASDL